MATENARRIGLMTPERAIKTRFRVAPLLRYAVNPFALFLPAASRRHPENLDFGAGIRS